MKIDIAVDSNTLIEAIKSRVAVPCIPGTFGLGGSGGSLMFDHVKVSEVTLLRNSQPIEIRRENGSKATLDNGHRVGVRIDFQIHLADRSDVIAGGLHGATSTIPLTMSATYDFVPEMVTDGDGEVTEARLSAVFVSKSPSIPDPALDQIVDTMLEGAGASAPIELGPLEAALDADLKIRNFGIAIDVGLDRVVMRVEIGSVDSSPVQAWQRFFDTPPKILGGRELAIRIDSLLLLEVAEERMKEALDSSTKLEILDPPVAIWMPSLPGMIVTSYVDVLDACPNLDEISLDITATAIFSIQPSGDESQFQTTTNFTWDVNDADVAACVLALTGPFFFAGPAVGPIVDHVIAIVVAAIFAENFQPDSKLFAQGDCDVTESDSDHIQQICTRPFAFTNDLLGTFLPDEVLGLVDGLVLRGDRAPGGPAPILPAGGPIQVTPLGWETKLNCNTRSVDVAQVGQVWLRATVCCFEILTTKDGAAGGRPQPIPFFVVTQDQLNHTLTIGTTSDAAVIAAYYAAPFPCQLLVCTGSGPRFINLGRMPAMPAPPDPASVIEAVASRCMRAYDRFWRFHLDVDWLVDPAPETEVMHHWDVVALGLHELDAVEMLIEDKVAARAAANGKGVARIRTVLPPTGGSIALRRVAGANTREPRRLDPARHRLVIAQSLLTLRGTLGLAGKFIDATSFRGADGHQLAVVTDVGLEIYVPDPVRAFVKRSSFAARGLRGVTAVRGGISVQGLDGIRRFDRDLRATTVEAPGDAPLRSRLNDADGDWLKQTLRAGPWLVHVDPQRRHLRVYQRGRPRLLTQSFDRPRRGE